MSFLDELLAHRPIIQNWLSGAGSGAGSGGDLRTHVGLDAQAAHGGRLGVHRHTSPESGGLLEHGDLASLGADHHTQYAHAEGKGVRPAYMAERVNRKITTGAGLTGGGLLHGDLTLNIAIGDGLNLSGNRVNLTLPAALSATSKNQASGSHTHQVLASAAPSGESLLKSSPSGGLRLRGLNIAEGAEAGNGEIRAAGNLEAAGRSLFAERSGQVFVNPGAGIPAERGALTVRTVRGEQRGVVVKGQAGQSAPLLNLLSADGKSLFFVTAQGDLESGYPGFVSGLQGWQISREGDAEFRNIRARGELHTSVFVSDEMHATGGTMLVMTAGVVAPPQAEGDNVIASSFHLEVQGSLSNPEISLFQPGDVLRIKFMSGAKEA